MLFDFLDEPFSCEYGDDWRWCIESDIIESPTKGTWRQYCLQGLQAELLNSLAITRQRSGWNWTPLVHKLGIEYGIEYDDLSAQLIADLVEDLANV